MKRYTETERIGFLSRFQHSNLSAAAFCRAQGISPVSLAQWRKRYARGPMERSPTEGEDAQGTPACWLPVVVRSHDAADSSSSSSSALPSSVTGTEYALIAQAGRLEVPRGFDAREVVALWQMLHASSLREVVS